ncbi:MAG: AcrR family transcriptional regulator [Halioglobus sp.]|jgi:AcrR family transcriptional regulator
MSTNKEKILEAASVLFLSGGTGALSVRAIARAAGVSTIGIYSHFEGKQGILDALYIEGFEKVDEAMTVATDGVAPRDVVARAASNYLDLAQSNRAHYRLIFGESDASYEPSDKAKSAGITAFEKLTGGTAGLLPSDATQAEKQTAALQVWSLMHGAVSLRHHGVAELVDMRDWRENTLKAVMLLIDGIVGASA